MRPTQFLKKKVKMNKKFYVTTPIYYPNDKLHIGHAYTTTLADYINRFKKLDGYETYFVTGSDEHGQKIEDRANEAGKEPLEFVTEIIEGFKNLWVELGIEYDHFIRTTDETHKEFCKNKFTELLNNDFIYKGEYSGLYCKPDESFFTETQLVDGKCPECGREVTEIKEESYFLKISEFQNFIEEKLKKGNILFPESRVNELINNFVNDLQDLSITRTSFDWGIQINEDQKHILYVWLDALLNYVSTFEYGLKDGWTADSVWGKDSEVEILQLVGKEITRFHSIYWPIMLEMIGYREPKVLAHGWIVSDQGDKMSKSKGNVVDPIELIKKYGKDSLRFYLINNIETGKDGKFSEELLIENINGIIVNKFSNLVSRTSAMNKKYFDGIVPKASNQTEVENKLWKTINKLVDEYKEQVNKYEFSDSLKTAIRIVEELNGYIDITEPWKITVEEGLDTVINTLIKGIYVSTAVLSPALVESSKKISDWLQKDLKLDFENLDFDGIEIGEIEHLFERIK